MIKQETLKGIATLWLTCVFFLEYDPITVCFSSTQVQSKIWFPKNVGNEMYLIPPSHRQIWPACQELNNVTQIHFTANEDEKEKFDSSFTYFPNLWVSIKTDHI